MITYKHNKYYTNIIYLLVIISTLLMIGCSSFFKGFIEQGKDDLNLVDFRAKRFCKYGYPENEKMYKLCYKTLYKKELDSYKKRKGIK